MELTAKNSEMALVQAVEELGPGLQPQKMTSFCLFDFLLWFYYIKQIDSILPLSVQL